MSTKTHGPDSHEDVKKPLFDQDTPQGVYDKQFEKIIASNVGPENEEAMEARAQPDDGNDKGAATDQKSKVATPGELGSQESTGASTNTDTSGLGKEAQLLPDEARDGGWYKREGKRKARGKFWTRKKVIGGGIAGILIGGGFGLFTLLSGPLQFVHAAQLLQQFHFGEQEEFFENRTSKLYRYFKYLDKPQNRKLSRVGIVLADRIDAKFKNAGIELEFNKRGVLKTVVFDVDTARSKGVDLDRIRSEFEVPNSNLVDGKLRVDIEGKVSTTVKEFILFRNLRKSLNISGLTSAIPYRKFATRNGITLHVLTRANQQVSDSVGNFLDSQKTNWKNRRKQLVTRGETPDLRITGTDDSDPSNTTDENGKQAAAEVESIKEVDPALEGTAKVNAVKSKLRVAGSATAITGIVCTVKGLADSAGAIEFQNVVMTSMRMGGYIMGLGSQVQAGNDLAATQLGFESELMYDKSEDNDPTTVPSSFFDAASIHAELGDGVGGVDTPNSARLGGHTNILTAISNAIPGVADWAIGGACKVLGSVLGQVLSFGVDLALAPVSAIGGIGASVAANQYMDDLARVIANEGIPHDIAGAAYGSVANQGAHFLANRTFMPMGAVPISETEAAQLDESRNATKQHFAHDNSWFDRYLSPRNANSMLAKAIDSYRGPFSLVSSWITSPSRIFSTITKPFISSARAATPYDYGEEKFAFRPSEIALIDSDESYSNPYENTAAIADKLPDLHKQYAEKCFGLRITVNEESGEELSYEALPAADLRDYPAECRSQNDDLLRYRLYLADLMTFLSAACYEGDTASCTDLGIRS